VTVSTGALFGIAACFRKISLKRSLSVVIDGLQHGQFASEADFDVGFDRGERFNRISTDNRLGQLGVVLV
jgi:hypothetical protein